ncbi:hypothetical protein GCM10010218_32940 [Streptomyces mashuensis]|uniref:Macro domain-containing protein n=1 Tax=Streptomyces mashuensis TaxID=33904 RepID=A0A919B3Y3_9ACTN|nr:hypothetical protein [Streptomyces mashuensis]GHF48862.1 hypothetical protein GCM10010218_32940 [Streptomyces mashuensis]
MSHALDVDSVLREVRQVRAEGLVRIRALGLPCLRHAAAARAVAVTDAWPVEVENLLRAAVARLGGGELQQAAELTLGLAPGMRDRPAADRRRLAAKVYHLSVDRFRKHQEEVVLAQIAEQVCWLAGTHGGSGGNSGELLVPRLRHRTLPMLTLHVHPVELLRDIDVVVSPSNTHLGLPGMYKASVAAALRRAGALRDAAGDVVDDPVHEELAAWRAAHGVARRPVLPGTVAPTGPGALAAQNIRRIYHAAVAVPRPGTNDYDVTPQDVAAAARRVLELMRRESEEGPPLRSVCFPLLGAGRGGLDPAASAGALWAALAAEPAPGRPDVHLVVHRPLVADVVVSVLEGA